MGAVIALDALLDQRRVWKGQATPAARSSQPTGHASLDAVLPLGGWPESALSEVLLPAPGLGELRLLWPTLARLTQAGQRVVLVAPPYIPYAPAWQQAGVDLRWLQIVDAGSNAPWATEQCLRSGSCAAVLCWLPQADDRSLRRLQVAAETGQSLAFSYRPAAQAINPSPAALRLLLDVGQVQVLKCRGGLPPARPIPLASGH